MSTTRKEQILEMIFESVDSKIATTAPLKKIFKKNELDEILEYVYEIFWREKFNPNEKEIAKEIKEYLEIQIKANSK